MVITITILGIFNLRTVNEEIQLEYKQGIKLEKLLKKIGKLIHNDIYRIVIEKRSNPIFLLNGVKLEIPEGLTKPIKNGDQLSILQALGGG